MEIKALDFFVGLSVGAILGVGGTWLFHRVRHWLGYSEVSRLRSENRSLKRRLAEKDRHIGRMLSRDRAPGGAPGGNEGRGRGGEAGAGIKV